MYRSVTKHLKPQKGAVDSCNHFVLGKNNNASITYGLTFFLVPWGKPTDNFEQTNCIKDNTIDNFVLFYNVPLSYSCVSEKLMNDLRRVQHALTDQ